MQSKKLYSLKNQAKKLRKLLKKYDSIIDFIIFGSSVKDKMIPRDFDIAVIAPPLSTAFIGEIKTEIDKDFKNTHIQLINYEDFLKSRLPYRILSEGYSAKEGKFLSDRLKIQRKVLYSFNLEGLSQVQKVMFNKGLRSLLKNTNSEKVGKGAILVSFKSSGEVEDFLNQWERKIRKKEFIEI